jgi:hypothetical protein
MLAPDASHRSNNQKDEGLIGDGVLKRIGMGKKCSMQKEIASSKKGEVAKRACGKVSRTEPVSAHHAI